MVLLLLLAPSRFAVASQDRRARVAQKTLPRLAAPMGHRASLLRYMDWIITAHCR